jgi:hypothetical protein
MGNSDASIPLSVKRIAAAIATDSNGEAVSLRSAWEQWQNDGRAFLLQPAKRPGYRLDHRGHRRRVALRPSGYRITLRPPRSLKVIGRSTEMTSEAVVEPLVCRENSGAQLVFSNSGMSLNE